jgi:hypothetical protein
LAGRLPEDHLAGFVFDNSGQGKHNGGQGVLSLFHEKTSHRWLRQRGFSPSMVPDSAVKIISLGDLPAKHKTKNEGQKLDSHRLMKMFSERGSNDDRK